jgi:MobA-like NTP transferase domain
MTRLGIIPAAGNGSRWGGYYKELLPCGEGEWLLDRCANAMINGGADAVLVVTRPDKVGVHSAHLDGLVNVPVFYAMNTDPDGDMWGSIVKSFDYPADDYLFAMPDTYFPMDGFSRWDGRGFGMGLFETNAPERFGVLVDNVVVNKVSLRPGNYRAWGLLFWEKYHVDYWLEHQPADYTQAINRALQISPENIVDLNYYYDFATFSDYAHWMQYFRETKNGKDESIGDLRPSGMSHDEFRDFMREYVDEIMEQAQ